MLCLPGKLMVMVHTSGTVILWDLTKIKCENVKRIWLCKFILPTTLQIENKNSKPHGVFKQTLDIVS